MCLLFEVWVAAAAVDLALFLYGFVSDHARVSPLASSRALGYSAAAWSLFVLPLGWLLALLPGDLAALVGKYAHVPFLAAQLIPLERSARSEPDAKAPTLAMLLYFAAFFGLNTLVERWLQELFALLTG
jgi:hypothetical protein